MLAYMTRVGYYQNKVMYDFPSKKKKGNVWLEIESTVLYRIISNYSKNWCW